MITKDSSNCDAMCWFSEMRLSFVTTLQDDSKDRRHTTRHLFGHQNDDKVAQARRRFVENLRLVADD